MDQFIHSPTPYHDYTLLTTVFVTLVNVAAPLIHTRFSPGPWEWTPQSIP